MLLNLKHKQLVVYQEIRVLVKEAYIISNKLPEEEKFNMISQMRRAALSIKLNLAEGSSRKSIAERNRFYEISRGSIVEIDAAIETATDLNYIKEDTLEIFGNQLNRCFAMVSKIIK